MYSHPWPSTVDEISTTMMSNNNFLWAWDRSKDTARCFMIIDDRSDLLQVGLRRKLCSEWVPGYASLRQLILILLHYKLVVCTWQMVVVYWKWTPVSWWRFSESHCQFVSEILTAAFPNCCSSNSRKTIMTCSFSAWAFHFGLRHCCMKNTARSLMIIDDHSVLNQRVWEGSCVLSGSLIMPVDGGGEGGPDGGPYIHICVCVCVCVCVYFFCKVYQPKGITVNWIMY